MLLMVRLCYAVALCMVTSVLAAAEDFSERNPVCRAPEVEGFMR